MDLRTLYRQVIMDHYKNPKNKGLKNTDPYHLVHLTNPSCGDDVTVQLDIKDGIIKDVRHIGTGCAICCSSASVMSETLKGKDIRVANEIIEDFYELIKGNYPEDEDRLGDAIVYVNIHNYPPRAKCATLAWRAAGAIIHGEEGETLDE